MKKSIKNFEDKKIKNLKPVKGGAKLSTWSNKGRDENNSEPLLCGTTDHF